MARKKPAPEHENLERWLVSYADFITLLFATFVVLYALSQVDIGEFIKLEEAMKNAFAAPTLLDGSQSVLDSKGESVLDAGADSVVSPLMLEYISQKYEEQSYKEIQESIKQLTKAGELENVEATITNEGLLITFKDDLLFYSGSAALTNNALKTLDKVGALILQKFAIHYMRIVGHTDSMPITSFLYPSNWELSSARASSIIRYFIDRFKFTPSLFTAVGYADTRPVADNKTNQNRAKNRRVEILVLKNKYKNLENPREELLKKSKKEQEAYQLERIKTVERVGRLSEAAKKLTAGEPILEEQAIKLKNEVNAVQTTASKTKKVYQEANKEKLFNQNTDFSLNKKVFDVSEQFKEE